MNITFSRLVCMVSIALCSQISFSQVGVGTTTPNTDAILDVTSTNAGLLLPRLALTATTSPAPLTADVAGMTVYNTATAGDVTPGFYYNDGADWIRLGGGIPVENGLYYDGVSGTNKLGGALVENTTITQGGNQMTFNLNGTGDFTVQDNGVSHFQVRDNGNSYFGSDVYWRDGSTGGTILARLLDSGNDGVFDVLRNGGIQHRLHGNSTVIFNEQSRNFDFRIESDTNINGFKLEGTNGQIQFGNYGGGAIVGTPTQYLAVDAAGNIIEQPIPGGASAWDLLGNAGTSPATNFLGTTDAQDLAIRTNNTEKLRVTSAGAVGIGVATPNAALEVSSATGGLLPPQVSLTDITVSAPVVNPNGGGAPVAGTFVWNTATTGVSPNNVVPGLYYWDGVRWVAFAGSPGGLDWSLLGNGGTSVASAFLGTIDTQDLALRTDNIERFRLDSAGRFLFNNPTPAFAFDLVDIDGGAGGTTTGYEYAFNVYGASSVGSSAAAGYFSQRGEGAAIWAENFSTTGTMATIFGESESAPVPAMEGRANFADTQSIGVLGLINVAGAHDSKGVVGRANINNAGWGYGVYGEGNFYGLYTPDDSGAGGVKTFLIDHPLDPENKLLRHYSVESNEVLNMYRGVMVFDANGNAKVQLPNYFTAININYSYQLSAIGQPMPNMYVKTEIDNNGSFVISGGAAGAKVSWTVHANRNDRYMQKYPEKAIPELDKKQGQKGKYMQPKIWDKSEEMGINYIKINPNLSKEK